MTRNDAESKALRMLERVIKTRNKLTILQNALEYLLSKVLDDYADGATAVSEDYVTLIDALDKEVTLWETATKLTKTA